MDFDNPDRTTAITVPGNPMISTDGYYTFVNGPFQDYARAGRSARD